MSGPQAAAGGIASTNPATGQREATFPALSGEQLEQRLELASRTFASYRRTAFGDRRTWLLQAADLFEDRADSLAQLATTEMGKTLASAKAEVLKCAAGARFYAENAERFMLDEPAEASRVGARRAFVRWQPLGPVLAVMPWNYPFWQVVRFAAPALMAGNVALLKHASNVPQCAAALEQVFTDAGFPVGAFQALLIGSAPIAGIVADPRVAAVTLTGSEPAGRAVGAAAGSAIKKVVLELGGSDPFVVMPSADITAAARTASASRFQNAGQSCISAKRFIVHQDCAAQFLDEFVAAAKALVVGDPLDARTDMGPLATARGRADIEDLVQDAVSHGADLLCGGHRIDGPGWFYAPTVLAAVTPHMRLYAEEAFGPVASVVTVTDLDQAIEVANSTDFGLGANAWTNDAVEQDRLLDELDAGAVFINGMTTSYPQLPFGGIKNSGHGRELAAAGLREFCNAKTAWLS